MIASSWVSRVAADSTSAVCLRVSTGVWPGTELFIGPVQKLYFAEYDLAFFKTRPQMLAHLRKCKLQIPPGAFYQPGFLPASLLR